MFAVLKAGSIIVSYKRQQIIELWPTPHNEAINPLLSTESAQIIGARFKGTYHKLMKCKANVIEVEQRVDARVK